MKGKGIKREREREQELKQLRLRLETKFQINCSSRVGNCLTLTISNVSPKVMEKSYENNHSVNHNCWTKTSHKKFMLNEFMIESQFDAHTKEDLELLGD